MGMMMFRKIGHRGLFFVLVTLALIAGCEQAVMNGPVGGSVVTVTELRSGAVISENEFVTDDLDAAITRWGAEVWEDFILLQQIGSLGIAILNTLPVEEDTWYLVTMEGGFDYAGYPDAPPVQVFGTIHAILSGDQLNRGGFVVGPLSEAAYQWLRPWYERLSDAELAAALLEFSEQLVTDLRDVAELDYDDLLTFNPLLHTEGFIGSEAQMTAMREALAAGDSDAAKLAIAEDMVAANAPRVAAEAVFRDNISPNISQAICIQCHVSGGLAGGTRHLLQRTSNSNHIALNVAMYANLVDALGVARIVSKPQGGFGHGGGMRLSPGSQAVADLEAFLNML